MENRRDKKKLVIISLVVAVFIIGIIAIFNSSHNNDTNNFVKAYIRKVPVGSGVTIRLTEQGKAQYPDADKYQIYYNGKLASAVEEIGIITTVFPARKAGDKIEVYLMDKNKNQIDIIGAKLIKE